MSVPRRTALLLACALVAPACASTESAPTGSTECVEVVLAAFRGLAEPAADVASGYESAARGGRHAARSLRRSSAGYAAAARDTARAASTCAEQDAVADAGCRAALVELSRAAGEAGDLVARAAELTDAAERHADAFEQEQVQLEGAAAAAAGCV